MAIRSLMTFSIEHDHYAIDAIKVAEIKDFNEVKIIPVKGPAYVLGLTYFDQHIVPVIDLKKRLARIPTESSINSVLFVQVNSELIGLLIAGLPNIIETDSAEITSDSKNELSEFHQIYIKSQDKSFWILNLKQLFVKDRKNSTIKDNEK